MSFTPHSFLYTILWLFYYKCGENETSPAIKVVNSILVYLSYNVLMRISSKRFDSEDSPNPQNIGVDSN